MTIYRLILFNCSRHSIFTCPCGLLPPSIFIPLDSVFREISPLTLLFVFVFEPAVYFYRRYRWNNLSTSSFTIFPFCRQTSAVHSYSPRLRRRFRRSILTAGNATFLFIPLDSVVREIWIPLFERFHL